MGQEKFEPRWESRKEILGGTTAAVGIYPYLGSFLSRRFSCFPTPQGEDRKDGGQEELTREVDVEARPQSR